MKTYFVDSFTNQRFKGNPAAVCLCSEDLDEALMQLIAFEIGFSETAFIRQIQEHTYSIRFFTPKTEIPLCGHATLAAAKVLFETTRFDSIHFINCEKTNLITKKVNEKISMRFPVYETEPVEVPPAMVSALGIKAVINGRYNAQTKIIMIEMSDSDALSGLNPDYPALVRSHAGVNGVLVTALSNHAGVDFQYRYFWPWAGTQEDLVTGGVQTFLAKYWAEKLKKSKLEAFQCSARTGKMGVEFLSDQVIISGEAVIMLEGEFKTY